MPEDVGIAGFNGLNLLKALPVRLATTDACRQEIGRRAAEAILARLEDPSKEPEVIELTPTLDLGASVVRARG